MRRGFAAGALLLAGCETALGPRAPVAWIIVTPDTATVLADATLQLRAILTDSAGRVLSGRAVTWSSSAPIIATVSQTGLVTGRSDGRVIITASAERQTGRAAVTVFASVAAVTVDQGAQTIVGGGALQYSATPRDRTGTPLAGRAISWSSSDTAIAPITAAGLATGRAPGAVTIMASAEGQDGAAGLEVAVLAPASLAAGLSAHTCAVTGGGRGFCWGSDGFGQLGNGPAGDSPAPIAVWGMRSFAAATSGGRFTCGLTPDGQAYCWGNGARGRLGNGSLDGSVAPVAVSGGLDFATLSAGWSHACGVTPDGAVYCWGDNGSSELGTDAVKVGLTPLLVRGDLTFRSIGAGDGFTCGLAADGTAYCWGSNEDGRLGSPGPLASPTPLPVAGALRFVALEAGARHSCALTADGAAYCWGNNAAGQLGDGSTTSSASPVRVAGGLALAAVSAGLDFTCGVTASGVAYCWGDNSAGQLGTAAAASCDTRPCSTVPLSVAGGLPFASVTAGDAHACGLTTSGVAYCWGRNASGQLGDGTTTDRATPVRVLGQP